MLFNYQPINHDFKKLHEFFEHTVLEVWCKPDGPFDVNKLHKDFQPIVSRMKVRMYKPIKGIYDICLTLTKPQLKKISNAFKSNNSINDLCEGTKEPVLYDEINAINPALGKLLKEYCYSLYEYVSRQGTFCKKYKSINKFYSEFVDHNTKGKCPFCGLVDLKSNLRTTRDAFDHYLPKKDFPFNTVNLQNIAPACHDCNSDCKKEDIPIRDAAGNKRKAFFPYSTDEPDLKIKVNIVKLHPTDPRRNDVNIEITSPTTQEKVDTWRDLFNIDEKYNDKCCSEDAKYWLQQVDDEAKNYGVDPGVALTNQINSGKRAPLQQVNFLRVPFLEGCQRAGIL
ncbi:MAG: hypothetical protein KKB30_05330 [Proteobacteria bacterium]|nr:hypothetical protein [Pseudomonadota bacterium]MBU1716121.1 hypothetical protein [Pseudomonadota bacterium]